MTTTTTITTTTTTTDLYGLWIVHMSAEYHEYVGHEVRYLVRECEDTCAESNDAGVTTF